MGKKVLVSMVLPTYNERGNILRLLERVRCNFKKAGLGVEMIVIDDDSSDGTGKAVKDLYAGKRGVKVIVRKERGLATAVRRGIEEAKGDVVVVMDTDFNHDPKLVPQLVSLCQECDVAVGSRYVSGGGMENKKRELLSRMFNELWVRPVMGSYLHDNLSGFFAIKREALKKLNYDEIFFGYGEYFCRLVNGGLKKGLRFKELACFYRDRRRGVSKSRFVRMFWDYVVTVIALRLRK